MTLTLTPGAARAPGHPPRTLEVLLAGGDRRALAEIHRRLHPCPVHHHPLVPLQAAADRIAAGVFAQIWSTAGTFDPRTGTATPWVMTIARERGPRHVRRRNPINHL